MRAVVLIAIGLAAVAGCGRVGFGSSESLDSASRDDAKVGCAPGLDLCDDFESPSLGAVWTADSLVTLDTTRARRGAQSVHVHMPALSAGTSSYQTLQEVVTITGGASPFWIRAWFWLSALPAAGNGLELVTAERSASAGDYLFVHADRTTVYSQFAMLSQSSATLVPTGTWFCVVWKVVRATDATGTIELSGDTPALTLANAVTDSATMPMTVVNLGIGFSGTNLPSAQPALDLWIDDVIAHSSAVSCSD